MKAPRNRRWFLVLTLVMTVSGFGAACGVKGPLYLPEEPATETEKEKDKDEEKTSRRKSAPSFPSHS